MAEVVWVVVVVVQKVLVVWSLRYWWWWAGGGGDACGGGGGAIGGGRGEAGGAAGGGGGSGGGGRRLWRRWGKLVVIKVVWVIFKEVAHNCHAESRYLFVANVPPVHSYIPIPESRYLCEIKSQIKSQILSPNTTYACYLVYKITEYHSNFAPPILVEDKKNSSNNWYIYLLSPQTRVINPKDGQDTHNTPVISKAKAFLNRGMMVWEVHIDATTKTISMHLWLKSTVDTFRSFNGIIVQGIDLIFDPDKWYQSHYNSEL
ncbi:hypothetical protein OSB04_029871, partial [Centaurea solstitialis]